MYSKKIAEKYGIIARMDPKDSALLEFFGISVIADETEETSAILQNRVLQSRNILQKNPRLAAIFEEQLVTQGQQTRIDQTKTISHRYANLLVIIANILSGRPVFDRQIISRLPFDYSACKQLLFDPFFGEQPATQVKESVFSFSDKTEVSLADFGCAPKKDGAPSIMWLKKQLEALFPEKRFLVDGYDIVYPERYPVIENDKWTGEWHNGYQFSDDRATYNGITYFNAKNQTYDITKPLFAQVPKYDFVINAMFYWYIERYSLTAEALLSTMKKNMLNTLHDQGVLFLNTLGDKYDVFQRRSQLFVEQPFVIPQIVTPLSFHALVKHILYGLFPLTPEHSVSAYLENPQEADSLFNQIKEWIIIAHQIATKEVSCVHRLFMARDILINWSRQHPSQRLLQELKQCFTDPDYPGHFTECWTRWRTWEVAMLAEREKKK
jgi:hypothetical protein